MFQVSPKKDTSLEQLLSTGSSIVIDPQIADRILAECHYEGQRKIDEDRALLHAERMENGTFLVNSQISFGRCGGRLYLLNGRHRMQAVSLAGRAYRFRIEIYECNGSAELDAIYCRFDQPGSQRTLAQVSRSLGLHDELEGGLRPAMAALLLRAVPLLMMDLKRIAPAFRPRSTRDLDAKKDFAQQWKQAAVRYQACLDTGVTARTGRFRNAGPCAVALATFRYQFEHAQAFWGSAIRNDGLRAGDPRQTLCNDFLQRARTSHEFDLAEVSAMAWNAFMEGRDLKICKVLGAPIRLAGTPYQGE